MPKKVDNHHNYNQHITDPHSVTLRTDLVVRKVVLPYAHTFTTTSLYCIVVIASHTTKKKKNKNKNKNKKKNKNKNKNKKYM